MATGDVGALAGPHRLGGGAGAPPEAQPLAVEELVKLLRLRHEGEVLKLQAQVLKASYELNQHRWREALGATARRRGLSGTFTLDLDAGVIVPELPPAQLSEVADG